MMTDVRGAMLWILVAVAVLVGAFFAARAAWLDSHDDETKIGWLVEGCVEDFNEGAMRSVMAAFAEGYSDETARVERERLRQGLAALVLMETQRGRSWDWCIEVPDEVLDVEVTEEDGVPSTARARFTVNLMHRPGAAPSWQVAVDADLEETDEGWRFVRSRHETLKGRRPR